MPMFIHPQKDKDIPILVWKIQETFDELCEFAGSVGKAYRAEALHFASEQRRKERLASRILFHQLFGNDKRVSYRLTGKPYVEGESCSISFSHTKDYVAFGTSPLPLWGIDIEYRSNRVLRVLPKVIRPEERKPDNLNDEEKVRYYLVLWSAKESVFKALDLPGLQCLDMCVHPFAMSDKGTFQVSVDFSNCFARKENQSTLDRIPSGPFEISVHYQITNDYVLTWCAREFK